MKRRFGHKGVAYFELYTLHETFLEIFEPFLMKKLVEFF